jgi:hypothetical protein
MINGNLNLMYEIGLPPRDETPQEIAFIGTQIGENFVGYELVAIRKIVSVDKSDKLIGRLTLRTEGNRTLGKLRLNSDSLVRGEIYPQTASLINNLKNRGYFVRDSLLKEVLD